MEDTCKNGLPTAQYSLSFQEYRDYCTMLALNNLKNGISVNIDMLLGEGQYITVAAQTKMDTQAFTQASKAAHKACLCLPHLPVPQESFPALRQGANEPYMSFVDKLQNAQSVQCSHSFTSDSVTP